MLLQFHVLFTALVEKFGGVKNNDIHGHPAQPKNKMPVAEKYDSTSCAPHHSFGWKPEIHICSYKLIPNWLTLGSLSFLRVNFTHCYVVP